jgi:hypothetical protein
MEYTKSVVTIEEENRLTFEDTLNDYLKHEYSIESSSCNCKTWKAILIKNTLKGSEK